MALKGRVDYTETNCISMQLVSSLHNNTYIIWTCSTIEALLMAVKPINVQDQLLALPRQLCTADKTTNSCSCTDLYFEQSFQFNGPLWWTKRHLPLGSPPTIPTVHSQYQSTHLSCVDTLLLHMATHCDLQTVTISRVCTKAGLALNWKGNMFSN